MAKKKYRPKKEDLTLYLDSVGLHLLLGAVANCRALLNDNKDTKYSFSDIPPNDHWEEDEHTTVASQERMLDIFKQLQRASKYFYNEKQ